MIGDFGPLGAQVRGQVPAQLAAGLHEQRPVDRLVAHPHTVLVRIQLRQHRGDLLRGQIRRQQPRHHQRQGPGQLERLGPPSPAPGTDLRHPSSIGTRRPTRTARATTRRDRPERRRTAPPRDLPGHRRPVLADQRRDPRMGQALPHSIEVLCSAQGRRSVMRLPSQERRLSSNSVRLPPGRSVCFWATCAKSPVSCLLGPG